MGASAEIQAAARLVVNENKRLRALLMKYGISSREINGEGEETASSVVENLEAMMGKRRACGGGSGGTGGRADVMAAESCEKSLVAIRYGHSQMPDRGLRQLQMRGTIPSPQSSGNGLRENGGSLAGNTGVLQQQQQHSEAHQQQQHQQQFATLRHTLPPQAPLPPQQNHAPIQSNTHTYATTSASASSSTSSSSNPDHIYATTSTYSPGSSSSLYGGNNNNNNNNNYPDYCYAQQHQQQQQNHQHNDFFVNNNLDIYSAVVPVPQHQQYQQQNQHQQNQQQPNTSASCRDIADAIRCIRPSLTLQELDEEMGCHQLCDADGGAGGSYSGNGGGGNGDCKVPHYKAFELMDRLSN